MPFDNKVKKCKKQKLKRKNTWVDINDPQICRKILQKYYGSLFPSSSNFKNEKEDEDVPEGVITGENFFDIFNDIKKKFFQTLHSKCRDVVARFLNKVEPPDQKIKNIDDYWQLYEMLTDRYNNWKNVVLDRNFSNTSRKVCDDFKQFAVKNPKTEDFRNRRDAFLMFLSASFEGKKLIIKSNSIDELRKEYFENSDWKMFESFIDICRLFEGNRNTANLQTVLSRILSVEEDVKEINRENAFRNLNFLIQEYKNLIEEKTEVLANKFIKSTPKKIKEASVKTSSNQKIEKISQDDEDVLEGVNYNENFIYIFNDLKSKFFQKVLSKCQDVVARFLNKVEPPNQKIKDEDDYFQLYSMLKETHKKNNWNEVKFDISYFDNKHRNCNSFKKEFAVKNSEPGDFPKRRDAFIMLLYASFKGSKVIIKSNSFDDLIKEYLDKSEWKICEILIGICKILEGNTNTSENLQNSFDTCRPLDKSLSTMKQKTTTNEDLKGYYLETILDNFMKNNIITAEDVEVYENLIEEKTDVLAKKLKKNTPKKIKEAKKTPVKDKDSNKDVETLEQGNPKSPHNESPSKKIDRRSSKKVVENNFEKKDSKKPLEQDNPKNPLEQNSPKKTNRRLSEKFVENNVEKKESNEDVEPLEQGSTKSHRMESSSKKAKSSPIKKIVENNVEKKSPAHDEDTSKEKSPKKRSKRSSSRRNEENNENSKKNEESGEKPQKNKENAEKPKKNKESAERTNKNNNCLLKEILHEYCQEIENDQENDLLDDEGAKSDKVKEEDLSHNKSTRTIEVSSNECHKVEVRLNGEYKAFELFFLELMKVENRLNINKTKAVITFKAKKYALKFLRNDGKLKEFIENVRLVKILPCEESTSALKTDNDSCNAVEFDIKQKNGNTKFNKFAYWYYCMSLISDKAPNVDKTTAVITFETEADAKNFIKKEKLNDLLLSRRLVKTKACKDTQSDKCNKVEVDIADKTGSYEQFLSNLMCNDEYNIDKSNLVITFKSERDARNFKQQNKLQGIVENSRLVKALQCDSQPKNSKGVSKRKKRKYQEVADHIRKSELLKTQMRNYQKRIKKLDEIINHSQE